MNPIIEIIRRYFSLKIFIISLLMIYALFLGFIFCLNIECGDGKVYAETGKNFRATVPELLRRLRIEKNKSDNFRNIIYNENSIPVVLCYDNLEKRVMTTKKRVKEILIDYNLKLDGMDKLDKIDFNDIIIPDMRIKIIRVRENHEIKEEEITFSTNEINNPNLDKGISNILVKGESGTKLVEYNVLYEDGREIQREHIKETVTKEPIVQVVEIGSKSVITTFTGEKFEFTNIINMRSTGYTSSYNDTGKFPGQPGFGITSTGIKARRGIVAVDPKVIPLGTKLYIEGLNGVASYGYAVAGDTGGAIKGNKIDLYFDNSSMANNWGCKDVKVYILK